MENTRDQGGEERCGDVADLYERRFDPSAQASKLRVWRVLCRHFFQRYVSAEDTVLDLGAGYCEFLNSIQCAERIAVETNPDVSNFAGPGVRIVASPSTDLLGVEESSVDVVFASNFFEHLPDTAAFLKTLHEVMRVLRPGGRLLVLQPNIAVIKGRFWDFLDHYLPLTERTVAEALELVGFDVAEMRARFLPYTTKSSLPQHPFLVWLYLKFRPAHWFLGGQAWIVGVKPPAPKSQ
ncbi:MAG: class I SAM-dependent methyltransferase [bacterium]|nr:class I SAM-dependent methyltransferase [bacterium]